MIYLQLFIEFFKTGLFSIGGGLATLPFLYNISAKYPEWFTSDMLADMLAVSESTPGPMGINMATYAGFHTSGILGSLVATFSLVLPAFVVIIIVAKVLDKFNESKIVKWSFYGLRPAVAGLIAVATLEVLKVSVFTFDIFAETGNIIDLISIKSSILFAIIFVMFRFKKLKNLHPII
ncbi:MAG: chromate transporter, partial [Oscillospiraceae bacterium]